jgi:hypothetical protein
MRLIALIALIALALTLAEFVSPPSVAAPGQSFEDARRHWAYQPIARPPTPKVRAAHHVLSPVDAFLLAKLEENGLAYAPPADARSLLRRVYFDLTGLPPTFEEIQNFAQDRSPGAFERVVDRLLASPGYGERWGRHWLDVARYADTKDLVLLYGKDALRPFAYTYRDYVVRAFNEDMPFDQFIRDQLAADLIEPKVAPWRLSALGLMTLGRMFDENPHDQIDDQIDTVTRGFLGLTVACARCHDHKYDAVLQKDYYSLYGVFASTERPYDLPLIEDPGAVPGGAEFEVKLAGARAELEKHIDAEFAKWTENLRQRIGDYLMRAATTKPDLTETTQFALSLTPEDFRPSIMLRTRRFFEQRVQPEDRVFGPWARLAAIPPAEFAATREERLRELKSATNFNPLVIAALDGATLESSTNVIRAYGELLREVYQQSKTNSAPAGAASPDQNELLDIVTGPDSPIWFPRRDMPDHMSRPEKDRYNGLVLALDKLAAHATNAPAARAMVLRDLPEPYQPRVFLRGNPARPGEAVPRAFLKLLSGGEPTAFEKGSGRLELARAIASPRNPLTARVFVNRVWMHHFGEPLAPGTTDFGTRSEPPLHQALLDWLAAEFISSGWSVKQLHRTMVLSAAYRQSSSITGRPTPAGDTDNKLLWHFPRRRLDFEAMRDSLLAVSGRLDARLGGRSVDLANDPANQRRTVYGLVDRQNLPATFRAFDFATPDQCAERRPRTTVPQQALFALNSPFVLEQARSLMQRPELVTIEEPSRIVDALFRITLGRVPTKAEVDSSLRFIERSEEQPRPDTEPSPFEQLAQVLLASNEFVFVD